MAAVRQGRAAGHGATGHFHNRTIFLPPFLFFLFYLWNEIRQKHEQGRSSFMSNGTRNPLNQCSALSCKIIKKKFWNQLIDLHFMQHLTSAQGSLSDANSFVSIINSITVPFWDKSKIFLQFLLKGWCEIFFFFFSVWQVWNLIFEISRSGKVRKT